MVFNNKIRPSKPNKVKEAKNIPKSINTSSVPISVYRELAAELQEAQREITYFKQENQKLLQQNQQLQQETEKLFQATQNLKQLANSFNSNIDYVNSVIEIKETRNNKIDRTKNPRELKVWFLPIAIVTLITIAFGMTFSLARINNSR